MVWDAWIKHLVKRRRLQTALARWQGKLLQQAFSQWLVFVEHSRSKQHSITKVCPDPVTLHRLCKYDILLQWATQNAFVQSAFVQETFQCTGVLPTLSEPQDCFTVLTQGCLHVFQALSRWRSQAASAAFAAWASYRLAKRSARRFAAHVAWTAAHMRLRRAFLSWRALRRSKEERHAQLLAARKHLARRRLCLCFDAW